MLFLLATGTLLAYLATVSIRMIVGGETARRTLALVIGAKRYRSIQTKGPVIGNSHLRFIGAGMLAFLLLILLSIARSFTHSHR